MRLNEFDIFILQPTLVHLGLYNPTARRLLLSTLAHETQGEHLDQRLSSSDVTLGPAIGLYQIEAATHDDLMNNFLKYRKELAAKVAELSAPWPSLHHQLASNLCYTTAIARLIYFRRREPLPAPNDIDGIWKYYKQWFNTPLGKAKREDFIYWDRKLVQPILGE
jgi:hypothetical protein